MISKFLLRTWSMGIFVFITLRHHFLLHFHLFSTHEFLALTIPPYFCFSALFKNHSYIPNLSAILLPLGQFFVDFAKINCIFLDSIVIFLLYFAFYRSVPFFMIRNHCLNKKRSSSWLPKHPSPVQSSLGTIP